MKISKFNIRGFAIALLGGILFVLALSMFTGCITKKKCAAKFPPEISVVTEHSKETIIKDSLIPGAEVHHIFRKDSLIYIPQYKWFTIPDTSGRTQLRYMVDAVGNLIAECETKDQIIKNKDQIISEKESRVRTVVNEVSYIPWYFHWLLGISVALNFLQFFRNKLRKFFL